MKKTSLKIEAAKIKSNSVKLASKAALIVGKKKEVVENSDSEKTESHESIEQEIFQQFQKVEATALISDLLSEDILITQSTVSSDWVRYPRSEVTRQQTQSEMPAVEKAVIAPTETLQLPRSEQWGSFESASSTFNFKYFGAAIGLGFALGGGGGGGASGAAPIYQFTTVNSAGGVAGSANLVINFDRFLDSTHLPSISTFTVTVNGVVNAVTTISVSGRSMTLTLHDALPAGYQSIGISYSDPTSSNDVSALQDVTGVDADSFSIISGVVIDGYISGASVYVDTNGDGDGTSSDYYVGVTDALGRFFLSSNMPKGNIVVSGGVNVDTGVSNTLLLRTSVPTDLSKPIVINPLTTLVTSMADDSNLNLTVDQAKSKVVAAFGISLPVGVDVFSFDPIYYGDVNAQKVSAQIATIVSLASNGQSAQQTQLTVQKIFENLATQISSATSGINVNTVQLHSAVVNLLTGTNAASNSVAISNALTTISNASSLAEITSAQSQIFISTNQQDTTAPSAPVITTSTATINSTTPTIAGTAEANSVVSIYDGSTLLGTATANGSGAFSYTSSALSQTAHSITAKATDAAGNSSVASAAITLTVDTTAQASLDQTAPTLAAPPPLAGTSNVNVNSNITLTFSEAVQAGTGNIIISDGSGDVRTIPVADATQVSIVGNVVTINPTTPLWLSTQSSSGTGTTNTILNRAYSVQMASGVLKDASNNAFAGISNSTTLSFTTASSNLTTIQNSGNGANRIDMVVIGDGYVASEIATGKLSTDVQSLVSYFFKQGDISQPFGRYASYFNIYAIEVASVESGIDLHFGSTVNVNTALDGTQLTLDRLLSVSSSKAEAVANAALNGTGVTADLRVASINSNVYGGAGGAWATYSGGGMEVALHEVGHSYAALADEYIDANVVAGASNYAGSTDFGKANVTIDTQALTWAPWLGKYQPGIGVIGAYQGANYYATGVYRPSVDSKMRNIGNDFDVVTREKFILSFYQNVDPLDSYSGSNSYNVSISALPIDPTLIDLTWTVDGVVQSSKGSTLDLSALSAGSHSVSLTAQDNTGWIRPAYMSQAAQTQTWTVNLQNAVVLPSGDNAFTASTNGWIKGNAGNDTITGTTANDLLEGGAGNDVLSAGDGDDVLMGGDGVNTLDGGLGINTVSYQGLLSPVTVSLAVSGAQQTTSTATDTFLNIQNLIGGSGADLLTGNDAANFLQGLGGNDNLKGGAGNNVLDGGDGNDTIEASNGNNRITGGIGDDAVTVGNGNNLIYGDDGNDIIVAGGGDNRIFGGAGNDQISVAGGLNLINAGVGNDTVNGGTGNDVIQGGAGTNTLNGGAGSNTLSYEEASTNLNISLVVSTAQTTGYSIDTISNFQNLIGGSGDDTLIGSTSANTLQGGLGNDLLIGGAGDDIYVGGGGSDTVSFFGATQGVIANLLPTNPNIDYVTGKAVGLATGEGSDTLWQISNLIGSQYGDQLIGDDFSNILNGSGGRDVLTGGGGSDTFVLSSTIGQSVTSTISYTGSTIVDPSISYKFYIPFEGSLIGGNFSFVVTDPWGYGVGPYQGSAYLQKATISGSSSDGTLANLVNSFKQDSDYSLMDYTIDLGGVNHSNAIAVTFKNASSVNMSVSLTSTGVSFPTLTDFVSGNDCINLSASIFSGLGSLGNLDPSKFYIGSAAHSSTDRIIYNDTSGVLSYDADGTGAAAAVIFATLSNKPQTLSSNDFVVI